MGDILKTYLSVLVFLSIFSQLGCVTKSADGNNRSVASSDYPRYQLHPQESWAGGSREAEEKIFLEQAKEVAQAQKFLATKNDMPKPGRTFHEKQHGCLIGELRLSDYRPGDLTKSTFTGLFSQEEKKTYTVVARFSSGVGAVQHDLLPDVKGLAIKIFNVRDADTGELKNVDYTMTNSPTPFGKDQGEFLEFMRANIDPGFLHRKELGFFMSHPVAAKRILAASRPQESVAKIRYWAGHAYQLSPNLAMKLNVEPVLPSDKYGNRSTVIAQAIAEYNASTSPKKASFEEQMQRLSLSKDYENKSNPLSSLFSRVSSDYLKKDLENRALSYPIQYVFNIQIEKDSVSTPIEDNLDEWTELESPSIPVGALVFKKQDISNPEQKKLCSQMSFTPGHAVSQHRPMSNMGRGRIFTYHASQLGRKAISDPSETSVQSILKISSAEKR